MTMTLSLSWFPLLWAVTPSDTRYDKDTVMIILLSKIHLSSRTLTNLTVTVLCEGSRKAPQMNWAAMRAALLAHRDTLQDTWRAVRGPHCTTALPAPRSWSKGI